MWDEPRTAWMSGDPTSARTSGSVTSVSSSCGLRAHFTYTTTCGSEISGIASSDAVRIEYTLRTMAAATSAHTTARHRMTALMNVAITGPFP